MFSEGGHNVSINPAQPKGLLMKVQQGSVPMGFLAQRQIGRGSAGRRGGGAGGCLKRTPSVARGRE